MRWSLCNSMVDGEYGPFLVTCNNKNVTGKAIIRVGIVHIFQGTLTFFQKEKKQYYIQKASKWPETQNKQFLFSV